MLKRLLILAVLAVCVVVPATSAVGGGYGMQHVTAQSLTVRQSGCNTSCPVLYYGHHFETQIYGDNGLVGGYAWGNVNGCGFVQGSYLVKHEGHPPSPRCYW